MDGARTDDSVTNCTALAVDDPCLENTPVYESSEVYAMLFVADSGDDASAESDADHPSVEVVWATSTLACVRFVALAPQNDGPLYVKAVRYYQEADRYGEGSEKNDTRKQVAIIEAWRRAPGNAGP